MRDLVSTSSNFVEAIINYINMLITNIIFLSGVDSHVIYTREWNNSDLVNSIKIAKLKTPTIYSSNYGCSVTRITSLEQHKPTYTISSAISPYNCIVLVQVVLAFKLYGTQDYQFKGFTCNHMIESRTLLLCVFSLVGQPLLHQKEREGLANEPTPTCPQVQYMNYQWNCSR